MLSLKKLLQTLTHASVCCNVSNRDNDAHAPKINLFREVKEKGRNESARVLREALLSATKI